MPCCPQLKLLQYSQPLIRIAPCSRISNQRKHYFEILERELTVHCNLFLKHVVHSNEGLPPAAASRSSLASTRIPCSILRRVGRLQDLEGAH